MTRLPLISIVLATHNRKDVVTRVIANVHECGLPRHQYELIVVDNASTDGTSEAVAARVDSIIQLRKSLGSCAKAVGVDQAQGEYLVLLDDDSYPRPGSLARMVEHFEADSALAAAGFTVHLPDGRQECGALPGVFVGCGVGLRAAAFRAVGGLDRRFFMQAEEYDLCFRLVHAGWRIAVFHDLHVEHLKSPESRRAERTTYLDTRNNLLVAARYLSGYFWRIYADDWTQRYRWLAERDGHMPAFWRGLRAARMRARLDRFRFRRHRLGADAFEFFFRVRELEERMVALRREGVGRILFADLGKNVYAFHHAARRAGIAIAAIADDRFAAPGRMYRGTPILPAQQALQARFDAAVVSNAAPVHAGVTKARIEVCCKQPVFAWYAATGAGHCQIHSPEPGRRPEVSGKRAADFSPRGRPKQLCTMGSDR